MPAGLDFKPLYVQVKEVLLRRLVDGTWRPGAALPSEFGLAAELRVSQGTVRKALDELTAQNILVRRQGRGTFVATHTPQRTLFHFFHLVGDRGDRAIPGSRQISCRAATADRAEAQRLGLAPRAAVVRIRRQRVIDGRVAIVERITLPGAPFAPLAARAEPLPNELYRLYETEFGVVVARAVEKLKAVAARPEEAKALGLAAGHPLLEIDRIAHGLDGRPVEWRVSRCETSRHHYLSEIE